jgi:MFS family permease
MAVFVKQIKWLYHEFGLDSLYETGRDAWLIILARACRMFAFGTNSLILALFFSTLNFTDYQIGLFMSLTLVGDVALSFGLTMIADRAGRRLVLFGGSVLMILSGAIFALFENFWLLLFAAVIGVISITGSDFGPFRSIEESTLSQITTTKTRPDILAWYVTVAALGSSIGSEASGRIVHQLQGLDGWTLTDAYHAVFWLYSVMGAVNIVLILSLSKNCEAPEPETTVEDEILLNDRDGEGSASDDDEASSEPTIVAEEPSPRQKKRGYFAQISKETRWIMYKLWFLLIVDSLADGMTPYSLTNYYLDEKFHLKKSTLGDIVSISYFLAATSTVFAGPLSRRIGLINTMVFTHIPSSTAVLLFPAPNAVWLTVVLLFIRTGLNNMDQAPRAAFIAAVVKPEERTAVMGITSMLRTLAATAGPSVTGVLAGNNRFWIAFVAAGALRLAYDFGLWAMFVNMKLYQHEEDQEGAKSVRDSRRSSDEEEMTEMQKL